ncbi:ABC-F family ATP-binding cassette domain-containing protein [Pseudomonas abietaniphila]|uniref:ATPase components of ABC transporters with duplicated ATPase domains n=1 Tax=Pseudomonas abietaniphila TaxID=89065 RepID=A0A1G8IMA4_9PSED|nr:ABC-F family ATP-binding cassette domain-containing protein [Pseudomonas abietaniphila]SDI20054.1 ATPase components of ABC transporters with duplicated ATPase domains [Pseudomonas abietaniphila]
MTQHSLRLDQVSLHLPDGRVLFDRLNHTFSTKATGIVGANGCGKSLLGQILTGERLPTSGTVRREGRIYAVAQLLEPERYPSVAALAGVDSILAALDRIAQGSADDEDHALAADQWDCAARLNAELAQIGLGHLDADSRTEDLSGGERQRVALLGAWLSQADWLILDEPSNHLDIDQQRKLAGQIDRWPNGLVLISHDRGLLEHVNEIIELSPLGLAVYGGNYSQYAAEREQKQQSFQAALQGERAQAKRERREMVVQMERQQRRNARGDRQARDGNQTKLITNAQKERSENSQGKSRLNQLMAREHQQQRITEARARCAPDTQRLMLSPQSVVPDGKLIVQLNDVILPFGYAAPVNLTLTGRMRVAILGPNGSGKSTLMRVIAGQLPARAGEVICNCNVAWLDQHAGLQRPERSAVQWLFESNPQLPESEARTRLAQMGIDADRVGLKTAQLSGGERLKIALAAQLYAQHPPQLLLLDEPDNHLDLPSKIALEQMLNQYEGALIVVSHDSEFLRSIGLDAHVYHLSVDR